MDELNIHMVAAGIRPGWLTDWTVEKSLKVLKRMKLADVLTARDVQVEGKLPLQGSLIAPIGKMSTLTSHKAIASSLGIPCGSRQAWMDPKLRHAFIVWANRPCVGQCNPRHDDEGAIYITSFWCASRAVGLRWCKTFVKRAGAFVRNEGLEIYFESVKAPALTQTMKG